MAKLPATKNCTIQYSFDPASCSAVSPPVVIFTESKLKVSGSPTLFQIDITLAVKDSTTQATGSVNITITPAENTKLTVESKQLLLQGDKGDGTSSLLIPSPPGGTVKCTVTAEISNAGQTKFKIN